MQIPAERWYQAIYKRRSRRQFSNKSLSGEHLDNICDFITENNRRFQDVRTQVVMEEPEQVFKGVIGSYGKIRNAPAYLAFIGQADNPYVQEQIGYMGEAVILEATSLGLATCWVGGFFKPEVAASQIALQEREKVFAVTPLGYAPQDYSLREKVFSGLAQSGNRKELLSMTTGLEQEQWPLWIQTALALARLAPSAVNRQPWTFTVEKDAVKVSVAGSQDTHGISKRLDCGIAMLHLEVGAQYTGVEGAWEHLSSPDVARFKVAAN
ncbi:MAG: nitroreductase family protein [Peptococcaceae bacterium]